MAELITQFRQSDAWKLLVPAALAANPLGLFTVVPETVRNIITHPLINLLLLYIFVVEVGADQYYALAFIVLMGVLYWRENKKPKTNRT